MENVKRKDTSDSKLQLEFIFSIGIISILEVISDNLSRKRVFRKSQNA